jgi:hypothetical protein
VSGPKSPVLLHTTLTRPSRHWYDDHLYSFWLSGVHWDGPETEFTTPFELGETEAGGAAVRLRDLELEPGRPIVYLFDFGDQWRVLLQLRERVPPDPGARYPKVVKRTREPPPQYTYDEEA